MLKNKSITLATMAEELNVSPATVSRALNGKPGKNAERIKKLAQELNFTPNLTARNLRKSSSHTVGVLITRSISTGWYSQLVCQLEQELSGHNKTMQLSISRHDSVKELNCLEAFRGNRVDGIIIGPVFRYPDLYNIEEFSKSSNIPLVCFGCMDDLPINYVTVDFQEGARAAVSHFYEKGHRDILYLGCPKEDIMRTTGTRLEGFSKAMDRYNLPLTPDKVIVFPPTRINGWKLIKTILAENKKLPSAIFCHNDEVAFGAMLALHQAGIKIPEDVSIIGYDDLSDCNLSMPPLTTIGGKMEALSKELVSIITSQTSGLKSEWIKKIIKPRLIERESVMSVKKS